MTEDREQPLSRILLPSTILSNAQSLRNKTEELFALVRFNHDFSESCMLAFTESWLSNWDSDADLEINEFGTPIRLDRDATIRSKSMGGGYFYMLMNVGVILNLLLSVRGCVLLTSSCSVFHCGHRTCLGSFPRYLSL